MYSRGGHYGLYIIMLPHLIINTSEKFCLISHPHFLPFLPERKFFLPMAGEKYHPDVHTYTYYLNVGGYSIYSYG